MWHATLEDTNWTHITDGMYIPKAEFDSKKPPQYSARERERARVYDIEYSVVVKHEYVRNCVHSHNYTRSQRSNKRESERASESSQCKRHASQYTSTIHRQSAIQREKKKCEKQSGPKSFAYNSRYNNNNNNNRTAAELKYQIYLNVRRICCAMCYAFTSVARVIKHIIHLTRASTNGLRNQTNERTNERTYQPNNLTAKPMEHEIYRNHSNMCEHSGKKRKQKQFLFIRWRIFINFNNVFLNVCHW